MPVNHRIVLSERPRGIPEPRHFELASQALPRPSSGEMIVETLYLSIDAALRGWLNDEPNYSAPVAVGEVVRSLAVGRVVESHAAEFAPGDLLYGWFGWQTHCRTTADRVLRRVRADQAPISAAAGVLGINGLTAWLALHDIGTPRRGETVIVSTAAGAVGSIVGQLAKRAGCRTVGLTGSDEKLRLCRDHFGYDAAINYRTCTSLDGAVAEHCPGGVDVFFDNAGGTIADVIVRRMNPFGRIIQCGTVATASWHPVVPLGPRIEREILARRLRMQGFVIFDHRERFDDVAATLAEQIRSGGLTYVEDIYEGLESAPQALADLYAGRNEGKVLVRIAGDSA
ncbi:MAG TPA: NADP-dependent oxidoreductase [Steroidobacteraceae bacterium]|nr:NADP-dependent oxidoreductase [Steroidobacteraceae bacterium]